MTGPLAGLPPGFDAYKTLQVDPEADADVIQAAYRRLAQKFHPDVAGAGSAERMTAINMAWELLRDDQRRAAYDRSRASASGTSLGPPASATRHPAHATTPGAAGPPSGSPHGSVLIGRYAGWSLGEIARVDIDYLEWLDRAPIGRIYRDEIDVLLRRFGRRRADRGSAGAAARDASRR